MSDAAYTPPVGMKSLERKLMHNGDRGADYFEPEWAEVRVVMRERGELHKALRELHAAVWNRGPMMTPDPFPPDHPAMKQARAVLSRV